MDYIEEIVETERIKKLKAKYWRYFDTKDWDSWLDLFVDDAILMADYETIWEPEGGTLVLKGKKEMSDFLLPRSALRKTVHHGHAPEICIISPTEATGIWAMEDILDYDDHTTHGHGHYHETYVKLDGHWKIRTLHLKRLRLKDLPKGTPL